MIDNMDVLEPTEAMEKIALACITVFLALVLPSNATIYTVGDSSGWDISSELTSWPAQQKFVVGDALLFQYSLTHSVGEVTKKNYDGCNTMAAMKTYSDGNTTIPLTSGGDKYFVCGSKLHCLGGMKLRVHVEGDEAITPAGAPALSPESVPDPTSKSSNPATTIVPVSHGSDILHNGFASGFVSFVCLVIIILQVV